MNPTLLFRPACARDAKRLTAIAYAAKRHWGYPEAWMEAWRDELVVTPGYIRTHPVVLAKQSGRIVGFFGLLILNDEAALEHFWLRPDCIGRGLGRALFAEAVRMARSAGQTELRIKSDPNAEGFYLKMGAVRVGLEKTRLLGKIRRELPLLTFSIHNVP
jgi:GNAT superfamily N-acetyltransferase